MKLPVENKHILHKFLFLAKFFIFKNTDYILILHKDRSSMEIDLIKNLN